MFEPIRLSLRGYQRIPFNRIELLDSCYRPYQYILTVFETNGRELEFVIEDDDNIIEIVDKVMKESCVWKIVITDYKRQQHYCRYYERK